MKRFVRAAIVAGAALLSMGAAPNWNNTIAKTDGGFLLGNPDAKVKIVAFESYTCPHCAHFEEEAGNVLKVGYIHGGKVSLEIRPQIRNPVDLTAAMLVECGDTAKVFANHSAFMLSQDTWLPKAQKATKAQTSRWYNGNKSARRQAIARDLGFYAIMEKRGYSRPDADRCLKDDAKADRLAEITTENREKLGVTSTPSFSLNGLLLAGTHSWNLLRLQIDARL